MEEKRTDEKTQAEEQAKTEKPEETKGRFQGLLGYELVGKGMARAQSFLGADRFVAASSQIEKIGHVSLLIAAVLGLLFGLVYAVKAGSAQVLLLAVCWILAVAVLQYIAVRFLSMLETLIASSPSRLSSNTFSQALALVMILVGVVGFVIGLLQSVQAESFASFVGAFLLLVLAAAGACLSFNPKLENVTDGVPLSAGEEAIGILTFVMKLKLRLVPVVFGLGSFLGAVLILVAFFMVFKDQVGGQIHMMKGVSLVVMTTLLPLGAYLVFCFYYLLIDVVRAILEIPRRLSGDRT